MHCIQNETLPTGSHMMLIGLADGRFLWESLHDRYHPLGLLNQDIRYPQLYEFLSCVEVTHCVVFWTVQCSLVPTYWCCWVILLNFFALAVRTKMVNWYVTSRFVKMYVSHWQVYRKWFIIVTRNTFCGTWYLPHSRVHKSMAELCSNFGDSAITKG